MTAEDSTRLKWQPIEISLLVGSVLLITLAAFEGLATTTIMPNVVADLDSEAWFSVASGAALSAQLSATVIAGALADSKGPRTVLLAGFICFIAGLLTSAFAPHIAIFVVGRLIQGLGGGLIIVPLYVFIGSIAHVNHRPFFFAAFSLSWVLPGLVGPAIAGYVAQYFGWRPVFWAVPFLALLAVLPLISVLRQLGSSKTHPVKNLKHLGLLALVAGTGVLMLQLSGALGGIELIILIIVGLVLTGWALPQLLPKGAMRLKRGMPAAIMTRLLAMGAQAGAAAFLPLVLQRVHMWNADQAALAVTIGTISWSAGATYQARVHDPDRRMQLPAIGMALLTLGLVPILFLVIASWPVWPALIGWFVAGFGTGLMHSTLSVLTLGLTDTSEHGKVASWLQVADAAGASIELALVSIAFALFALVMPVGSLSYLASPVITLIVTVVALVASLRIKGGDTPSAS